jgi:hypothetical protein
MGKLDHLPFTDWILSGETLTLEQNRSLQEHLRSCPECSQVQAALVEVQLLFRPSMMAVPAAGFTDRWQQHLTAQRIRHQRRNAWIFFFIATAMAVLILSFISWRFLAVLSSPTTMLSSLVYLWTFAIVLAERLQDLLWGLARLLPAFTYLGLVFLFGFISLMNVLWLVTYRQLTSGRRSAI